MKVAVTVLVLVGIVSANPAKPSRHFIPGELDPNYKRYIPVETADGSFKIIDLLAQQPQAQPRVVTSDVEYDLYTPQNKATPYTIRNNDVSDLSHSQFDPSQLTIFVAHGWNNNRYSSVNTHVRDALFGDYKVNLFIVDWGGPADQIYLSAKSSVVPVGEIVGQFIAGIQEAYGIDGSKFIFAGHSLGAHVAGSAGAYLGGNLGTIIGLDPAGPLFSISHPEEMLDVSDAQFVEIIHTNGYLLGFGTSIGDVDYYPNGGMGQPGCGLDLAGTCAHSKAYKYFAEALLRGPVFEGRLCDNYDLFLNGDCANQEMGIMGELQVSCTRGDYFLETNPDEPFGQGD